jgi:aromatic-L-amino-acid decarboxylase
MISIEEFREHAHLMVDWMADYYSSIEAPQKGEPMSKIFEDFKSIIMPGITHWQNPKWFAYFQANSSYPSVLAEMLTATLATQCMVWETSPAAAELEEKMMVWLKDIMGLPEHFEGVIQDTASTATLCAFLSAREMTSNFKINSDGFSGSEKYRIYCSTETHSSIDKAIRIAGMGNKNLVKVEVDDKLAMKPENLENAIKEDINSGKKPLCIVATIGTTSNLAIDPLSKIVEITQKYGIWLHVDAAYAGSAMILPEYRWMADGLEHADSYVFNPHKWLFTNFDLSAYYVKDKDVLIRTFSIMPEYLKTRVDQKVNNYRDWGIQLGRRFRALKLWFVLRNFGIKELKTRIKKHIEMVQELATDIKKNPDFELVVENPLNMICFRFNPGIINEENALNSMNERILHNINATGQTFLTHTRIRGIYVIRLVAGQTYLEKEHLREVWQLIRKISYDILKDE